MMDLTLFNVFLVSHIIAGHFALIGGLFIFFSKKGNKRHKNVGKIYALSMLVVVVSALYMAVVKDNLFLLLINIFVLYQLFAGWMSVRKKMAPINIVEIVMLLGFIGNATLMILTGSIVLVAFGFVSLVLALVDIRFFYGIHKESIAQNQWLARHIGLMTGSFIGAVTAFLVVNLNFVKPGWIIWFLPTIVLVPVMRVWTVKYVVKTKQTA